jgi:AAA domain/UvrD-like helicase C-terminal domain/Nuclease-related domain
VVAFVTTVTTTQRQHYDPSMAHIHPPLSTFHPTTLGAHRERDILLLLAQGLPDSFDVFHSVAMSSIHQGEQKFGELDIIVLSPAGHIVLLEIKSGDVAITEHGIAKSYAQRAKPKDVAKQVHAQRSATVSRLQQEGLGHVHVAQILVLPDYHVQSSTLAYPRNCIVDATELGDLCHRIMHATPAHVISSAISQADRQRVSAFLENRFQLHPDVSSYVGQLERTAVALSDGLATWVPRISSSAGVYTVQASAGSGKTQLAVALLRGAVARKERCAYVCYNRPLADHIVRIAPSSASVSTFHELCIDHLRQHPSQQGVALNFARAGLFADAAAQYVQDAESKKPLLDLLIIDEAQDFDPEWVAALLAQLKPNAKLYVMGDVNQDLYGRGTFELPDAVRITSPDNFRSPRRIVHAINALALTADPVVAKSLFDGTEPEWCSYPASDPGGLKTLEKCVKNLLQSGVQLPQIVLLSYAGRERSHLLAQTHLGKWPLKCFTGQFDSAGNAQWRSGELLAETLHRFKGQAAPVVVLCEVDFDTLDGAIQQRDLRKLFVGFTRAQYRLVCVLSERAEAVLAGQLVGEVADINQ